MAKKKKSAKKGSSDVELATARATIKTLKATVATLEKNVAKLEKRASKLKTGAKDRRDSARRTGRSAVTSARSRARSTKKVVVSAVPIGRQEAPPEKVEVVKIENAPKSELTVTALRGAARAQGIPGYSRMTKDQLIAALARG